MTLFVEVGDIILDIEKKTLSYKKGGASQKISPGTLMIAEYLMTHIGKTVPKQDLAEAVEKKRGSGISASTITLGLKEFRDALDRLNPGLSKHVPSIQHTESHGYTFLETIQKDTEADPKLIEHVRRMIVAYATRGTSVSHVYNMVRLTVPDVTSIDISFVNSRRSIINRHGLQDLKFSFVATLKNGRTIRG